MYPHTYINTANTQKHTDIFIHILIHTIRLINTSTETQSLIYSQKHNHSNIPTDIYIKRNIC